MLKTSFAFEPTNKIHCLKCTPDRAVKHLFVQHINQRFHQFFSLPALVSDIPLARRIASYPCRDSARQNLFRFECPPVFSSCSIRLSSICFMFPGLCDRSSTDTYLCDCPRPFRIVVLLHQKQKKQLK